MSERERETKRLKNDQIKTCGRNSTLLRVPLVTGFVSFVHEFHIRAKGVFTRTPHFSIRSPSQKPSLRCTHIHTHICIHTLTHTNTSYNLPPTRRCIVLPSLVISSVGPVADSFRTCTQTRNRGLRTRVMGRGVR